MPASAIVARELMVVSRQGRTYRRRASLTFLLLAILAIINAPAYLRGQTELSVQELPIVAPFACFVLMFYYYNLALWLVPVYVSTSIAAERDRRTLGDLLLSRLSSAEIVLGKLAAGLTQFAATLALGLPIMALLPFLSGVSPGLVMLAFAGIASTAYFVGGLSIVSSVICRRSKYATQNSLALTGIWLLCPGLAAVSMGTLVPRLWPWLHPLNNLLLASSPFGVFLNMVRAGFGGEVDEALLWMIGLQTTAGTVMIGWAIVRLRPASRKIEEGRGGDAARPGARRRWRLIERPRCGNAAMRWKELHTAKSSGITRLSEIVTLALIFVFVGYLTLRFGWPAAREWFEYLSGTTTIDVNRVQFNNYLRFITSVIETVCLVVVGAMAAEGITSERAASTWDSLLATPLDGREIILAKMLGATWKARGGILAVLLLWTAGLLTGSLHPVGVAAALSLFAASVWFMAALGTYASLVSRDTSRAAATTTSPLIILTGSFLFYVFSSSHIPILFGAGSVPFVNFLSLVSYQEFAEAVKSGRLTLNGSATLANNETVGAAPGAYFAALAGYLAAAAWFTWFVFRRFDRAADRATRQTVVKEMDQQNCRLISNGSLSGA